MSQVVEILENFQSSGENEEEQMIQNGSSSLTIYEVPKGGNGNSLEGRNQSRNDELRRNERRIEKSKSQPSNRNLSGS